MTTIPSQLPQLVTAVRTGTLQALALHSGQTLDARIIGAAPNGGTQVEIRGQLLNLVLPVPVKAGDTIQLQVQGTGQQMKLTLQTTLASPVATPIAPAALAVPAQPSISTPLTAQPTTAPAAQAPTTAQLAMPTSATSVTMPVTPQAASPAPSPAAAVTPNQLTAQAAPITQQAAPAPIQSAPPPLYPQSPANPNPAAVAHAATAMPNPAPAVPNLPGSVQPVVGAASITGATGNPLPASNPATLPAPPPATTPQAALAQMIHAAVPQQGSVTALTTALTSIAGKVVLPEPVAKAAQQVLAGRVSIDAPRFNGASLQSAVRNSGVFQEASLAQGQSPLPQTDMKSALLTLRQTLTTWLGQQAPMAAVSQIAPPLRGVAPRARNGEMPAIDVEAPPEEIGKHLLERTESALARTRLHQHASLPDAAVKTADWSMDLPVLIGQQQALLQFQIHRDQHSETDAVSERGWQMRFAINLPNMGEVGAQVSLRAGTTGVMLWASDPEASAALDSEVMLLREALSAARLKLGAVIVRHGEPPTPTPAPSGHFLDSRS